MQNPRHSHGPRIDTSLATRLIEDANRSINAENCTFRSAPAPASGKWKKSANPPEKLCRRTKKIHTAFKLGVIWIMINKLGWNCGPNPDIWYMISDNEEARIIVPRFLSPERIISSARNKLTVLWESSGTTKPDRHFRFFQSGPENEDFHLGVQLTAEKKSQTNN